MTVQKPFQSAKKWANTGPTASHAKSWVKTNATTNLGKPRSSALAIITTYLLIATNMHHSKILTTPATIYI